MKVTDIALRHDQLSYGMALILDFTLDGKPMMIDAAWPVRSDCFQDGPDSVEALAAVFHCMADALKRQMPMEHAA